MREGFISRRSNLTTIATSARIKIASFLAMTAFLLESVNGTVLEDHFNAIIDLKKKSPSFRLKRSEMEKSLNYVDGVATFKENSVLVILLLT